VCYPRGSGVEEKHAPVLDWSVGVKVTRHMGLALGEILEEFWIIGV
jgi:hypothetical protein